MQISQHPFNTKFELILNSVNYIIMNYIIYNRYINMRTVRAMLLQTALRTTIQR